MCLVSKNIKRKRATKDIECYKLLSLDNVNEWVSPLQRAHISRDIIGGNNEFKADGDEHIITMTRNNEIAIFVTSGFIHTFEDKFACKRGIDIWGLNRKKNGIFKCIIPKGTVYYAGCNEYGFPSYASKEIKFVEQIEL